MVFGHIFLLKKKRGKKREKREKKVGKRINRKRLKK